MCQLLHCYFQVGSAEVQSNETLLINTQEHSTYSDIGKYAQNLNIVTPRRLQRRDPYHGS